MYDDFLRGPAIPEPRDSREVSAEPVRRPAVFLDQDGTLLEGSNDGSYAQPSFRFTRGALPALRALAEGGFALVVVTNQPELSLGRLRRATFQRFEHAFRTRVRDEVGVDLTAFMVCPHAHPTPTQSCLCRKPAPGLLRQAAVAQRLDLAVSWTVGDLLDDVEAGRRAGTRSLLLDVGNETAWRLSPWCRPVDGPHPCCAACTHCSSRIWMRAPTK